MKFKKMSVKENENGQVPASGWTEQSTDAQHKPPSVDTSGGWAESHLDVQYTASAEHRLMSSPLLSNRSVSVPNGGHFGSLSSRDDGSLVACPSCRGLGKVPKEFQEELVALIPMKDKRLKPRRTVLYVCIAVGLCAVAAGLTVFFLIPRDVILRSDLDYFQSEDVVVNKTSNTVSLKVLYELNITNQNYVKVSINGIFLKALYYRTQLGQTNVYKNKSLEIPLRSDQTLQIPIRILLQGNLGYTFVDRCLDPYPWDYQFRLHFEVAVNYTLISQTSQSSLSSYQQTSCKPSVRTTTTRTTTTSTVSTTR